jgi:hypothetical protein
MYHLMRRRDVGTVLSGDEEDADDDDDDDDDEDEDEDEDDGDRELRNFMDRFNLRNKWVHFGIPLSIFIYHSFFCSSQARKLEASPISHSASYSLRLPHLPNHMILRRPGTSDLPRENATRLPPNHHRPLNPLVLRSVPPLVQRDEARQLHLLT